MNQAKSYLLLHVPNLLALLSQQRFPSAHGRAVVVVSDTGDRGVVRSVSPEAAALGVRKGLLVRDLRRYNGHVDTIPEEPSFRLGVVQQLTTLLQCYTPSVRVLGEERFLLDLTGTEKLWGPAKQVGERLLDQLSQQWGVAASIGVGPSRTVAYVAASVARAPGCVVVEPDEVQSFLDKLPVGHLPKVGPKTRARLERYGIRTIGELASVGQELLVETFDACRGMLLWRLARGQDMERLKVKKEIRSLERQTVLPEDTLDTGCLESFLAYLCGRVALDLQRRKLATRRITLEVRYSDGISSRINRALPRASHLETELATVAKRLLEELLPTRRVRIARVGISVSKLDAARREPVLFDVTGLERQEAVADELAHVRGRYGFDSVLSGRAHAAVA